MSQSGAIDSLFYFEESSSSAQKVKNCRDWTLKDYSKENSTAKKPRTFFGKKMLMLC